MALYRDVNGKPGAKVSQSIESQHYVGVGAPARWMTFPATPAILQPGKYWIAIMTSVWDAVGRNYADATPGNWAGNANPCCTLSQSFGPASTGTGTISVFALYKPGTTQVHQVGRVDVARTPSKGLTANFLRGSLFSIDMDSGPPTVVDALYAYLDGNGGAGGSQQLRMQLYSAKAEEHAINLKTQSEIVSIPAGQPPGWVRFPVAAVAVDGNFLIMIESGNTAGVVRDYGDSNGTGNWLGLTDGGFPGVGKFFDDEDHDVLYTVSPVTLSVYAEYFIPR
jgi:hypothetical protein